MAKKKAKPQAERRDGNERRAKEKASRLLLQDGSSQAADTDGPVDVDALRAGVGRGTLAEHALDSIAAAVEALEQIYLEVAAVGKSLALAREQLAEQEAELEAVRDAGLPAPQLAGGEPVAPVAVEASDGASPEQAPTAV